MKPTELPKTNSGSCSLDRFVRQCVLFVDANGNRRMMPKGQYEVDQSNIKHHPATQRLIDAVIESQEKTTDAVMMLDSPNA